MKKKLVLLLILSIICLPLCLGFSACSQKAAPDKLEVRNSITIFYGESVDLNDLDVKLIHPNGETEDLFLKTAENYKKVCNKQKKHTFGIKRPEVKILLHRA